MLDIFGYIDRLRTQPIEVRRQVTFVVTAVSVLILIGVWLLLVSLRSMVFSDGQVVTPQQESGGIVSPY